jgi:hypothetical protein
MQTIREIIGNAPKSQRRAKKTASDGKSNDDKAKEMVVRHARYARIAFVCVHACMHACKGVVLRRARYAYITVYGRMHVCT